MVVLVFSDLLWASGQVGLCLWQWACARCGFFFLLWIAGSGGVGVFRSVVGKWACVCVCGNGSGLVLVVGFFFFFFAVDCRWWWWLCLWLTVQVVEIGGIIFFW